MNHLVNLTELNNAKNIEKLRITDDRFGAAKTKLNVKSELLKILPNLIHLKTLTLDDPTSNPTVKTFNNIEEINNNLRS